MNKELLAVEELEEAVTKLSPDDFTKFRKWFAEFAADAWDRQIERDAHNGKLDKLCEESLRDYREGRYFEI